MAKLTFLSSIFLILGLWPTVSVGQSDIDTVSAIKREVQLSKTIFFAREPIWILISYTNVSPEPQKNYAASHHRLVLQDSSGTRYKTSIHPEYWGSLTLAPNETSWYEFDILQYYGIRERKFRGRRYLPAGHYTVYDAQGKYKSNILEFDVIDPEGIELKAMRLLKQGYNLRIEKKGQEAVQKFREIVERYPESVYAPTAIYAEISTYQISLEDADKAQERRYELIEKYPASGSARARVAGVAWYHINKKGIRGKADACEALLDLIQTYPDSRIADRAKSEIQSIEKWYLRRIASQPR
jgi:hypothetical protein